MTRIAKLGMLLALALVLGGCSPASVTGGGKITVTAWMTDSAGLFVGNDVGILGVTVGKVTAIEPDGTRVKVTLKVDKDQAIPADAGAVVVARSVATDRYVELTPVYKGGARMKDGAEIAQDRTRTPVDFDDVLGALNTFATGIAGSGESRDAIKNILASGSAALEGNGPKFNAAVTKLGAAVDSLSANRGSFTSTVKSLDKLTSTIAQNQQLVKDFVSQVSRASAMLAGERKNFQAALRSLGSAVTSVADFAHQNRQQLVTALDQSSSLLRSLLTKKGRLTEVLRVMPLTLQNLSRIYDPADRRLRVRLDPLVITPLGSLSNQFCQKLPVDVCAALGPSLLNLNNLIALLGVKR